MLHGYQRMKIFIESLYGSYIEFHQLNSNVILRKSIQGWKAKKNYFLRKTIKHDIQVI